jgi:bifunctional non-homologous end joining protein LigD
LKRDIQRRQQEPRGAASVAFFTYASLSLPRMPPKRRRLSSTALARIPGAHQGAHPGFIEPCLAILKDKPPTEKDWIYEIKHDGYRAQAHVRDGRAIVYSRRGYDWSDTFRAITDSLAALQRRDVILDGEVVALNEGGISDFHLLQSELVRKSSDRLVYLAFDIPLS